MCLSEDPRFASILSMDPASGDTEIVARGVRNTVGFAWHPVAGQLWFTDNGRDLLGDDVPPEEVNVLTEPGQHFGYPFVHATGILDPRLRQRRRPGRLRCARRGDPGPFRRLGVDFYTGGQFPERYRNALFIAEHGSGTAPARSATWSASSSSTAASRTTNRS